jgi:hypothetical protein
MINLPMQLAILAAQGRTSTRQESVSQQNPVGTGRVPHVRLSVRGPNKMGEAHHSFLRNGTAKAIETYHFRLLNDLQE